MTMPLSRDHFLVKEAEKRNRIKYSDVVNGVGTECTRESRLRKHIAVQNIRNFKEELSSRNCHALGEGIIRSLLAIETETDDDGIPLEKDENKITDLISEFLVEMHIKSPNPALVSKLTSHVLENKEVLFYTKYKLLNGLKKSVTGIDSRIQNEREIRKCIAENASSPTPSTHVLIRVPQQKPLAVLKSTYIDSISNSLDKQVSNLAKTTDGNQFIDQLLLTELISAKRVICRDDPQELEPLVEMLCRFISNKRMELEENFIRAFLQTLVAKPEVMHAYVTNEDLLPLIRQSLNCIAEQDTRTSGLANDIMNIVRILLECISPNMSFSPQVDSR